MLTPRPWGNVSDSLGAEGSSRVLRVGMDIGSHTTVYQMAQRLGDLLVPRTHRVPTLLAYSDEPGDSRGSLVVGDEALARKHEMNLVHPLQADESSVLGDFAGALRSSMDPDGNKELWGVINCPQGIPFEELKRIRLLANHIFDRTSLLDPALLMATSFGSQEVARNSIWIDLGATSVRVSPVHGGSPAPGETRVVPGGGDAIDARLEEGLRKRYPDLLLSAVTINRIKECFAHLAPESRPASLRVWFEGREKVIDIASIVRRACEPLVDSVLEGLRSVLGSSPSDSVEELLENIIVVGGGARMMGIGDRLREECRREFGQRTSLRIPEDPTVLVANGGLRWAHFLREEEWEIPLFLFAP